MGWEGGLTATCEQLLMPKGVCECGRCIVATMFAATIKRLVITSATACCAAATSARLAALSFAQLQQLQQVSVTQTQHPFASCTAVQASATRTDSIRHAVCHVQARSSGRDQPQQASSSKPASGEVCTTSVLPTELAYSIVVLKRAWQA